MVVMLMSFLELDVHKVSYNISIMQIVNQAFWPRHQSSLGTKPLSSA